MIGPRRPSAPARSILALLDNPKIFAPLFPAKSWGRWRVFLAALFGLPMSETDLAVYRHHTGRTEAPTKAFAEAALVCGRRGGKSRILALIAVFLACFRDYSKLIAPGETPVVAIIAADRRQAKVILGYIVGLLRVIPALAAMIEDELAESVKLTNGISVEVHTGSIGAPRGRTFLAVLADEIAFWASGDVANPDREVIAAVRPGLATLSPHSVLLMASSPYARRGVLFETFSRYFGKDAAPVLVWRGTTEEMNPRVDRRIIEEAYAADPESASAEYGAEFRTDITAFIGRDAVKAVVADGILELPPAAGIRYAAFVDPSGGSADSMTLAIGHMGIDGIAVLDATRERKPPFSPEDVTAEFCELLRAYGITRVFGDAYAGEWPRERFALHGIAYELSGRNKSAIYQDFLPALNGRRIRILDQPRLLAQLCNLERRVSRGGRDSIDHGPGQHDDVANAVCGVLTSVINDRRPALMRQADMLIEDRPVALPAWATCAFSTLVIGEDGMTAVAYFAYHEARIITEPAPLTLVDFDLGPLSGGTIRGMFDRLEELHRAIRRVVVHLAVVPPTYLPHVHLEGYSAEAFPDALMADLPALAIAAAGHVNAGRFKIAEPAMEKGRHLPLAGALDFRAGDAIDANPLRVAILAGIGLGLTPESATVAPFIPAAQSGRV